MTSAEERVLILAPRGRDAQVIHQLLQANQRESWICPDTDALATELRRGAGVAVVTQEALLEANLQGIQQWLAEQPSWSDFPFVMLSAKQVIKRTKAAQAVVSDLANIVVLERPISGETLTSAVDSALRARRRQYQLRSHLREREHAEEQLRRSQHALAQLNETLEARIAERTRDLAHANDRLVKEIAERERAQQALVQAQKMEAVGQLTNGIAHDFNNLLTAIVGNVDMIGRRTTDERLKRLAGYAQEAAHRATRLTGQLLAFSRTQRLDLRSVDVDSLIEGMNDLVQRSIGPSVAIALELRSGSVLAVADANQLELAILNLVINARDAMPDGGLLTICTDVRPADKPDLNSGRYVVISIEDTGSGIPPHLLQKVFEPFFTTKPTGKGTGLGLSQVYGITQQSGGTARIASTLGKGTTVELWLPVSDDLADRPSDFGTDALAVNVAHGESILVVEDDRDVRRFIVECLRSVGYRVSEADNGYGGLEMMQRQQNDALIVDFAMPGIDGAEFANCVRAHDAGIPIIFVTGYADMNAIERVAGPTFLLRKPFEVARLASIVREALAARKSEPAPRMLTDSHTVGTAPL
jgi:signal transduction histidine kinase/ActR/RegA family two-component response regulator